MPRGPSTRGAAASVVLAGVLAACTAAGGTADRDEPRAVEIAIDGYHFVPDHFTVAQGETVRFLITNPDRIGHELFMGTVAEQAARRATGVPGPSGEAVTHFGYGIYIPAFADGELDYTFSRDDDLLIGCHLPGHWEAGMVATVDVQP